MTVNGTRVLIIAIAGVAYVTFRVRKTRFTVYLMNVYVVRIGSYFCASLFICV